MSGEQLNTRRERSQRTPDTPLPAMLHGNFANPCPPAILHSEERLLRGADPGGEDDRTGGIGPPEELINPAGYCHEYKLTAVAISTTPGKIRPSILQQCIAKASPAALPSCRACSLCSAAPKTPPGNQPIEDDWAPAPLTDFTKNILFYPAADAVNWHTRYARTLQLPDESLLMTLENYPIWKSDDGGATWYTFSQIEDQVNWWGMRVQPFLCTPPEDFGGYTAGTILATGINLYTSTGLAKTWTFVSHVGDGPETTANGDRALWEPFIVLYDNQITIFYSDQTGAAHSQKFGHKTTDDLRTWSDPMPDVAFDRQQDRAGMTTVAHIQSTDKWIMTFEYCGAGDCKVHYKVADSPLLFDAAKAVRLHTNDTAQTLATSGPYVIWTPHPDRDDGSGLIIISVTDQEFVYVGEDNADPEGGQQVDINHWSAYTRSLRIVTIQGQQKLLYANGGNFGPGDWNSVRTRPN